MIELKNFSFQYREDAAPAIAGVNLSIPDGAFVGVTGAAGAGKSTLTYAMNGIVPHCYPGDFYGTVLVEGLDTCEVSLTDISRLVGSVCQDIESQFVASVVDDEMLYGLENFGVPHDEVEPRIVEALEAMGIAELRERPIASLSGGQKQKVAIASILALKPRVLVLDEPTAELDPASSVGVFDLLARYAREHGTTVVVVEQKIALLSEYADLLVVVDGGRIAYAAPPAEVLEHADELLELGVSCPRSTTLANRLRARGLYAGPVCKNVDEAVAAVAEVLGARASDGAGVAEGGGAGAAAGVQSAPAATAAPAAAAAEAAATQSSVAPAAAPAIAFEDVEFAYEAGAPVLHGVSFTIAEGDFVAFVGTNGAGKSTTMRLLNGLLKPTAGRVLIDGVPTAELATSQLARRVGFLFQNPDRQICCNTVREELLFGFACVGEAGPAAEARVDAIIQEFGFDPEADPFLLNRGTRQLLALASIIVVAPPVIVLDEPTTGLDYRECMKVMEVVRRLHEGGTTVVMVCHDMEVVADFAARTVVMHDGRVLADGPTFEVLRDRAACAEASVLPPQAVGISLGLAAGYPELAATPLAAANTVAELEDAVVVLAGAAGAAAAPGAAAPGAAAPAAKEARHA